MKTLTFLSSLAIGTAIATVAFAATPIKTVKTDKGDVLAGEKGMTLYTFKNDKSGTSNCYDKCATNWPPLMAPADPKPMGGYTIVMRDDGSKQWAYNGWPLYYWSKDAKPGDRTGEGMLNGAWKVARP